jgi:hypothetical protein
MLIGIKFNVMQNMIMNNEFKHIIEIIEEINRSLVAHSSMIASFNYEYNSSFLGKYCWVRLELNICLRRGINVPEQPFMIKSGISASPTDLEGFILFMALQTSASEIGQRIKIQKIARE